GQDGSFSEGLRMKLLPQAIATGNIHIGTIAGKLKGVIPAHTPSGWRIEYRSMPAEMLSENSPFIRCGMPQANSTTSRPRWIEPLASESTLPCSEAMSSASSSMCRSISSLKRNITRARVSGEVSDQPAKASFATAIARSTSALEARGTLAEGSPEEYSAAQGAYLNSRSICAVYAVGTPTVTQNPQTTQPLKPLGCTSKPSTTSPAKLAPGMYSAMKLRIGPCAPPAPMSYCTPIKCASFRAMNQCGFVGFTPWSTMNWTSGSPVFLSSLNPVS